MAGQVVTAIDASSTFAREWTICGLEAALPEAISWCRSDLERANVKAFHGVEIRRKASALQRPLTRKEAEIASRYGWRAP
jgi:hypothetical protein